MSAFFTEKKTATIYNQQITEQLAQKYQNKMATLLKLNCFWYHFQKPVKLHSTPECQTKSTN